MTGRGSCPARGGACRAPTRATPRDRTRASTAPAATAPPPRGRRARAARRGGPTARSRGRRGSRDGRQQYHERDAKRSDDQRGHDAHRPQADGVRRHLWDAPRRGGPGRVVAPLRALWRAHAAILDRRSPVPALAALPRGLRAQAVELAAQLAHGRALALQVAADALHHPPRRLILLTVAGDQLLAQPRDFGALGGEQALGIVARDIELGPQPLGLLGLAGDRALGLLACRRQAGVDLGGHRTLGVDALSGVGAGVRELGLALAEGRAQRRHLLARRGQLDHQVLARGVGLRRALLQLADDVADVGLRALLVGAGGTQLLQLAGQAVALVAHIAQLFELVLELLVRRAQAAVGEPQAGQLLGLRDLAPLGRDGRELGSRGVRVFARRGRLG